MTLELHNTFHLWLYIQGGVQVLNYTELSLGPTSATDLLCNLGQLTQPL
jgi:hypothetical protein